MSFSHTRLCGWVFKGEFQSKANLWWSQAETVFFCQIVRHRLLQDNVWVNRTNGKHFTLPSSLHLTSNAIFYPPSFFIIPYLSKYPFIHPPQTQPSIHRSFFQPLINSFIHSSIHPTNNTTISFSIDPSKPTIQPSNNPSSPNLTKTISFHHYSFIQPPMYPSIYQQISQTIFLSNQQSIHPDVLS